MAELQLSFVDFKKDAYIVVEGHNRAADRFFIIRGGKVRISKSVQVVQEEGGNILGPGDFFAVVSSMSSHGHIETAQAVTDVTLISVHKDQFGDLIKNNAAVAMKIIMQFSKRMRYLDEALTRLTLKSTAVEDTSHLFNIGAYYAKQKQFNQAYYAYHQYVKYCPSGENVNEARDMMARIAPYAKALSRNFKPNEMHRDYPQNSMLFCENEPGDELFIIQKGSIKISKIVDNKEVLLSMLKAGDIFGEMSLLESKLRSASAIANEDCSVMAVNQANFQHMIHTNPQIIARLTTLLAERIWLIYKQLANALIEDTTGRVFDMLLIQLEKNRIDVNSTAPYTFEFGTKELATMLGLPFSESSGIAALLLENKFQLQSGKIAVPHISEVSKLAEMHKRIQQREKARLEAKNH
jgi:CRP-like cAMP-binding protein